jgi:predicted Fe-Mo cluster-binding NifX family protein
MYKVAFASTREGQVYPGHFAHAEVYQVFEYTDDGRFKLLDVRENPLGLVPDIDVEGGEHEHHHVRMEHSDIPLHGPPKYMWLRENILHDVDVVIATDACQTSYRVFTSQGVRIIFTDPVPVEAIVRCIEGEGGEEFKRIIESYFKE